MLDRFPIAPTLAASDVERAKTWYSEKLGLEPTFEWPGGLMYSAAGNPMGFGVYLSPNAGTNRATSAAWMVDDLDKVMSDLRGRGLRFEDYDMPELLTVDGIGTSDDGTRSAWFIDSEGNTLMIMQLAADTAAG